ncbi:MAG: response regulator [Promethearchaeota archaeon]|nr:MAG: response regulator [Candidatus Lokiarchaeota archaeon]
MASVLIVEDDMSLQRLYEMILKTSGYRVIGKANNGDEAVRLYRNHANELDIILMDHRMPIKNGIEATREILGINNHTKIIFTSADKSVKKQALLLGAISFLEKPFSFADLVKEIERVLKVSNYSLQ